MTAQEIEKAARELCRFRGVDPDQPQPHGAEPRPYTGGFCVTPGVLYYSPAWMLVAPEVVAWDQVRRAVESSGSDSGG